MYVPSRNDYMNDIRILRFLRRENIVYPEIIHILRENKHMYEHELNTESYEKQIGINHIINIATEFNSWNIVQIWEWWKHYSDMKKISCGDVKLIKRPNNWVVWYKEKLL